MSRDRVKSTREKALRINLDKNIYGSFGEIGAGQEVANHFYRTGGASGTIAFSLSAYDMKISDFIYGHSDRYVSKDRLKKMLKVEFKLTSKKLVNRAETTRFFTSSNTVEVLNFNKTNQGHGWLGVRFQLNPMSAPNECIIHVNLHDNDQKSQQNALGVLGVNLLYACYFYNHDPKLFLKSLLDNIEPGRVEVNMFELKGPDFKHIDNRLMALRLVKYGMTEATIFGSNGELYQPAEYLYKKNVLVIRGRFRPVTHVNIDMLEKGRALFFNEDNISPTNSKIVFELTLNDLSAEGSIIDKDFLDRVDILCALGHTVMISNYIKYYKVVNYLSQVTKHQKIGVILGVSNLQTIFEEKYYKNLQGGILEAFGLGFGNNLKLFVYPAFEKNTDKLKTVDSLELDSKLNGLMDYLKANNKICDIENANTEVMHIFSDKVLQLIKEQNPEWEKMVPDEVAKKIKSNELFSYESPISKTEM